MRRAVPLLILALLFAIPATAQAFTWTRVWAPEYDLSSYGAIGVGDIRVHGSGGLNRDSLEAEVAAALASEGYLDVRDLDPSEKAQAIAVEITGSANASTDTSYGSTPVQREYWVTRDVTDERGRTRQIQQREYRTEYIQTETLYVNLELTLTATHVPSGTVLGTTTVTARNSQYWQENYGWRRSWDTGGLVSSLVPDVAAEAAAKFSPYREEMHREFRPERNAKGATKDAIDAANAGDLERSLQLFTAALSENPKGAWDIYGDLAMVYEALGRLPEAKAALETGLAQEVRGAHDLERHLEELMRTQGLAPVVERPDTTMTPLPMPTVVTALPKSVQVVRLDGDQVFLDAGLDRGWTTGMALELEQRATILDLQGQPLGEHSEVVGQAVVVEVYEHYAVANIIAREGDEDIAVGCYATPIEAEGPPA